MHFSFPEKESVDARGGRGGRGSRESGRIGGRGGSGGRGGRGGRWRGKGVRYTSNVYNNS